MHRFCLAILQRPLRIKVGYSNRTIGDSICRRISVEALDGPMHYLKAVWSFEPRGEDHTQVNFSVSYEFSNPLLAAVASRVFGAMFGEVLNAFERRAAQLFRNRTPWRVLTATRSQHSSPVNVGPLPADKVRRRKRACGPSSQTKPAAS
jgi:uncharacterized membrane protein